MGFRNLSAFNKAMLTKQSWRLLTEPNSFWTRVLKGIYFLNCSLLEASRGMRPLWTWVSILESVSVLNRGVRWKVGNGRSIRFWDDLWIPGFSNFKLSSACDTTHSDIAQNPHTQQIGDTNLNINIRKNHSKLMSLDRSIIRFDGNQRQYNWVQNID